MLALLGGRILDPLSFQDVTSAARDVHLRALFARHQPLKSGRFFRRIKSDRSGQSVFTPSAVRRHERNAWTEPSESALNFRPLHPFFTVRTAFVNLAGIGIKNQSGFITVEFDVVEHMRTFDGVRARCLARESLLGVVIDHVNDRGLYQQD